ncbi:MAG: hypothetical protein IPH13_15050 [Planctomycetes bacterium]|nr:hypothetical protein [Planctomycetota bacterium]
MFGWSITSVEDITGDGLPEFAGSQRLWDSCRRFDDRRLGDRHTATPEVITNVLGAQLDTTDDLGDGNVELLSSIWSNEMDETRGLIVISSKFGNWLKYRPDSYSNLSGPAGSFV